MKLKEEMKRRTFLKTATYGLLSLPFLSQISGLATQAYAATLKMIDAKSIKRLKYVADSNKEKPVSKKFKKGDHCLNCKFYKRGSKETDGHWDKEKEHEKQWYAKCTMAANKYVARAGYCKVYSWDKKRFPVKA